ncbi:hypothetical protein ACJMK2_040022 [Sinanodonta woodiana]|uniref:alpha-1,2-Mannosidase n=1 Tax=Sinanodonta woodiana TaxID=1069815 RepID=A0ABD3WHT5_SINWO
MTTNGVVVIVTIFIVIVFILEETPVAGMTSVEKRQLKEQVIEMFNHAYGAYMRYAFPADDLMPLSCKGRYRGREPSRGDVDDALGNFTLTLIDTLDTLAVLGDTVEFEKAVKLVIEQSRFDSDIVVSVFETNIRVLGGLLGGHVLASYFKKKKISMDWYKDELLYMAKGLGYRLLPAFNTTTGIPYPRINLKYGIDESMFKNAKDTCTACAGTMILEFAALSRLTGDPIFEEKAHKVMDYLWSQRHRSSDLVGLIINIHNGDWVRRESGVGAGIDSYYEYVLKAYILLGDDTYLERFNKHYDAIMKYVSQGPMLVDVHMHRPLSTSKHFMDALLAFWPGLQVLKGDIQPAIETHEMLYQVVQKHNFLPEAFTNDFRVHWGQSPLRPEFVESTYFLYKATGDHYYLDVGKKVIENLNKHARVPCGFAAIKDVTLGTHEDQMDSFVLAETFKYLYLLYAEKSDLLFDVDDYIFTTEAHLLPLSLSIYNSSKEPKKIRPDVYSQMKKGEKQQKGAGCVKPSVEEEVEMLFDNYNNCPNPQYQYRSQLNYAQNIRTHVRDTRSDKQPTNNIDSNNAPRLKASEFMAGNREQLQQLQLMGIRISTMSDGRIQLLHTASEAISPAAAENGLKFMQEMIELSKRQPNEPQHEPMLVQLISEPFHGSVVYKAGPAQFGYDLKESPPIIGHLAFAEPYKVCSPVLNPEDISGRIAILERGDCMFVDKARHLQKAGAIGGIVIDHMEGSSAESQALFAMSGDGQQDVQIPLVFLFQKEGQEIIRHLDHNPYLQVLLAYKPWDEGHFGNSARNQQTTSAEIPSVKYMEKPTEDAPAVHIIQKVEGPEKTNSKDSSPSEPLDKSHDIQPDQWLKLDEKPVRQREIELHPLKPIEGYNQMNIKTGSSNVQMEVKVKQPSVKPESPEVADDDVIQLIKKPYGRRELLFKIDKLSVHSRMKVPELNDVYEDLVKVMVDRTNFNELENKGQYLISIARLLESAYFGINKIDEKSQKYFDEMASKLTVYDKKVNKMEESVVQQDSGITVKESVTSENSQSNENLLEDKASSTKTASQSSTNDPGFQENVVGEGNTGMDIKKPDKTITQHYATEEDFNEKMENLPDKFIHAGEYILENEVVLNNDGAMYVDEKLLKEMGGERTDKDARKCEGKETKLQEDDAQVTGDIGVNDYCKPVTEMEQQEKKDMHISEVNMVRFGSESSQDQEFVSRQTAGSGGFDTKSKVESHKSDSQETFVQDPSSDSHTSKSQILQETNVESSSKSMDALPSRDISNSKANSQMNIGEETPSDSLESSSSLVDLSSQGDHDKDETKSEDQMTDNVKPDKC